MVELPNFENLINKVHLGTSPDWFVNIPDEVIALTITSPPYFDDKLYVLDDGSDEFGWNSYDDYKEHLQSVIAELFQKTIPGGRLALVISNTPQLDSQEMVTHFWPIHHDAISICLGEGWQLKDEIIWRKPHPTYNYLSPGYIPETQLLANHDTISILRKPGDLRPSIGHKRVPSVWEFDSNGPMETYNRVYPSFPEGLVSRIIKLWSLPNDIVFDPYAGSGQVVRIAKALGRLGLGVEADIQWQSLWNDLI
jgi:DNA modification methylase